jgi:alpha-tubulin suppressor-like RCC1 family protein
LEDGRAYGLGINPYNGFGMDPPASNMGSVAGLGQLRSEWGAVAGVGMTFFYSLLAIRKDGSVWTSGYDTSAELGLGTVIGGAVNGPVPLYAETCTAATCTDRLTGVTAIVSNDNQTTLALKAGGILGWGQRRSGLLGPDDASPQLFPREVSPRTSRFTALSSGHTHALVIGPHRVVYAWGSGFRGALGDGVDGGKREVPGIVYVP